MLRSVPSVPPPPPEEEPALLAVLTEDEALFDALRQELKGYYFVQRAPDLPALQTILEEEPVSAMLLDVPADEGPCAEFLRQNELTHPALECAALMEPASFCRMALSKSRNLFALLRPVEPADVVRSLKGTRAKLSRAALFPIGSDPYFIRLQEQRFWLTLIHAGIPDDGPVSDAPPPIDFPFRLDQPILPVLVSFRGWLRPHSRREREVLRFGLRALAEQLLPQQYGGVAVSPDEDGILVLLYGDDLPPLPELEEVCRTLISTAEQGLHCNVSCYCGEPVPIHRVAELCQTLIGGDRNNVVENQAVFTPENLRRTHPPLTAPMPQNWMIYFTQGKLDDYCRCIRDFFQQAVAAGTLDREFLSCFQQDMVQELGFALKSAGVPARALFGGSRGDEEMRDAVRSVPAMEQWLRRTAERAMVLTGASSENPDAVQTMRRYLEVNADRPACRQDLSELLHLSQGHIARMFRRETGMSISDYVTSHRMEMARRMLEQSELPPGTIAERCGYADYSYFFKTFKKQTGLSPTEYREQMHN